MQFKQYVESTINQAYIHLCFYFVVNNGIRVCMRTGDKPHTDTLLQLRSDSTLHEFFSYYLR